MIDKLKKEMEKYKKMLRIIDGFRIREPKGYLKYQERGGHVFYYQVNKDIETGLVKKKYIKQKEIERARRLELKHYYAQIRPIIEQNLREIERFIEKYDFNGVDAMYDKLAGPRKVLIEPIDGSREALIRAWNEQTDTYGVPYPEYRIFKTEQGELVRSKSEVIIANTLFTYKGVLLYKYEKPLEVIENGKKRIIHPDFTVLNLKTGKIKYWEHSGLLDDKRYADDFIGREHVYINNNLLPGRDIIHSYETSSCPLNPAMIKKIIQSQIL